MAVVWDKALYDLAYSLPGEPEGHPNTRKGIRLHYCRAVMYPMMQRRAQQLVEVLGLTKADSVLIVGCGFGWTVEALNELGYTAVGTDISPYIQGSKDVAEDDEIKDAIAAVGLDAARGEGLAKFNRLKGEGPRTKVAVINEDSTTEKSRAEVAKAIGRSPTVVITEDLVPSLTDEEGLALHAELEKYNHGARICHLMVEFANPASPFNLNSKSRDDWKLLFPTATIIPDGYSLTVV